MEDITAVDSKEDSFDYSLFSGLLLAGVFFFVRPLWITAQFLVIIIHELGHTIFGWLFGFASIPALDLKYGGGWAYHQARSDILLLAIYGILLWGLYNVRNKDKAFNIGCVILLIYGFLAHTDGHQILIIFMGHGFELVIASVFLFRAFSGSSIIHQAERPLYGALGFFIVFNNIWFAYSLLAIPAAKHRYMLGKGGHLHDFHRIANILDLPLSVVAGFFLLTCFLPPIISYFLTPKN